MADMTCPLAPLFAQVREVVPREDEIERRVARAEVVLDEPDQYPRSYVWSARAEIAECERLREADAALSSIEQWVRDMEKAQKYADAVARVWIVGLLDSGSQTLRIGAHPLSMVRGALAGETDPVELGCEPAHLEAALATSDCDGLRAALSASGARNRVAREKEEE